MTDHWDFPAPAVAVPFLAGRTGVAVAAIVGIILDKLVPGTPQERGLVGAATTPADTAITHEDRIAAKES